MYKERLTKEFYEYLQQLEKSGRYKELTVASPEMQKLRSLANITLGSGTKRVMIDMVPFEKKRIERGWNKKEVSEMLGMQKDWYYRLVEKEIVMEVHLNALLRLFGVSKEEVFLCETN